MLLIRLLNLIKGYLIIEIKGLFTERFLNICTKRGIHLWNIIKSDKWKIRANISIAGFRMLRPIAKKSRCEVQIIKKKGIPFLLYKHRKRKAFAVGLVIFIFLIYYMSTFIWMLNLSGNKIISTQRVIDCLAESGIKAGMKKAQIDLNSAQRKMMTKLPEAGWIGLNIKGSTVIVQIKERAVLPPVFEKDKPCNIIAANDGVITDMDITNGVSLVKENDVVKKGQVLVTGALSSQTVGMRFVHSDGTIMARTWHEDSFTLPYYREEKVDTGKNKSKHSLKIFDFYVKLYINDRVDFKNYERVSYVKSIFLGNNNILPISFHYDDYNEQQVKKVKLGNKQAISDIKKILDKKYEGMKIVKRDFTIEDGKIKSTYECIENITQKVEINYEEAPDDNNRENP